MANFELRSFRGGQNSTDSPTALADDAVVEATNVEWRASSLGERRRGAVAIDGGDDDVLVPHEQVTFLYRHLPTNSPAESELWALGTSTNGASTLARRANTWTAVSPLDAIVLANGAQYQLQAQTLHGRLFIAYKSAEDRLHVWDGVTLRRCGLAEPAGPPTGSDNGSGTFATTRYYRVRFTEQAGGITARRSEPSETLTFAPSGTGSGVEITRPAIVDEGETHWELEASLDDANFYRIATQALASNTYVDTTAANTGYTAGVLSDTIGDYNLIGSGEFVVADQDRLLIGGSFNDANLASRVSWTPVFNDPGVSNDERIPIATDNFQDLDGFEGGRLTGLSTNINGYIYAFKQSHIYKLVRTGVRQQAYEAIPLTKSRGALKGSVVNAFDEQGRPGVFFLDPDVGGCVLGANGLQQCGADILDIWRTVNLNASVVARAVYYPDARQVHWWIATGDSDVPDTRIVLHLNEIRLTESGYRRGWAVWNGPSATALAVCLYADNVDTGGPRSNRLVPFIARAEQ